MLEQVCQLARNAGDAIMEVYDGNQPINVASKKDDSPVTAADIAAHKVIVSGLQALDPDTPILSEEDPPAWEVRQHWQRYWLVDPLDGTKEFIKRNGEFTVNIALIENGKPTLGVVYAPVMKVMYSAQNGKAWKEECGVRKQIQVRDARPPLVVISRSHSNDPELQEYLEQLGEHQTTLNRFVAEILPGGGRSGPALSALRADQHLGHCRRPCGRGGRRGACSRLAGENPRLHAA